MPSLLLLCAAIPGLYIFCLGVSVFVYGRPVILQSRWLRIFTIVAVCPILLIRHYGAAHSPLPLFWILLIGFSWRASRGYSIYGISSTGLREALLGVLRQLNLGYEENMTGIVLKGYDDARLSTSMTGFGIVRLRASKAAKPVLGPVIKGLRQYFRDNKVKMTYTFNIFYALMGLVLLASLMIAFMNVHR